MCCIDQTVHLSHASTQTELPWTIQKCKIDASYVRQSYYMYLTNQINDSDL